MRLCSAGIAFGVYRIFRIFKIIESISRTSFGPHTSYIQSLHKKTTSDSDSTSALSGASGDAHIHDIINSGKLMVDCGQISETVYELVIYKCII